LIEVKNAIAGTDVDLNTRITKQCTRRWVLWCYWRVPFNYLYYKLL